MKLNALRGVGKVYRFSLKQTLTTAGWLISTIVFAVLLLFGIPLILLAISSASADDEKNDPDEAVIRSVYVCDETAGDADYSVLKDAGYTDVTYTAYDSMDAAIHAATKIDETVILHVTEAEGRFLLTVVLADGSALSRSDASDFARFAENNFGLVQLEKAALSPEGATLLKLPVSSETRALGEDAESDDEDSMAEELVGFIVPFLMLMLVYFMVLMYGQSVANSVKLEKDSKLIETVLTMVHPFALMTGKLFAGATAAVLQILIWLCALLGGMFGGAIIALRMVPDTSNSTVLTLDAVTESGIDLSVGGILLTVIVLALGLLLYLSLSCVAGALATKAEDLNKTNVVFVLVLVVSFFLCFSPSESESGMRIISDALWLKIFPFTSILVVPGDLVLGRLSAGIVIACLLALIAACVLLIWAAAAIYKLLVLYRGAPPTPKALLRMFKESRGAKQS